MEETPQYCVYYDKDTEEVLDILPNTLGVDKKNTIINIWEQEIPRKILKVISEGETTMQMLRKTIGHSNSTLHENVKKLEELGIISTTIIYEGNKIRLLAPKYLFVTKSPKLRVNVQRFFQGLWVDGETNQEVVRFLQKHPDDYFTAEEIALKAGIPVDQVELVLSNWDSQVTRALSDFLKKRPFEKKIMYKGILE